MTIHKEGYKIILATFIAVAIINTLVSLFIPWYGLQYFIYLLTTAYTIFTISFFRIPKREMTFDENKIVCPCDGKVVVIEEMTETEYFNDQRIQVSIFMSPANVHVNRNPIEGEVKYSKYHPGKFLVAWDPKSSTDNERHSVVLENSKAAILVKQIAGFVARRIVNYSDVGRQVKQNDELGFIKFGSRVDLYLPLGTEINVKIDDVVKGGVTTIGTFSA